MASLTNSTSSFLAFFAITPISSATIILCFLSTQLASDCEVRAELVNRIRSIREKAVIVKNCRLC